MAETPMIGRIRKIVHDKGYGFILTDAEEEIFFHVENTIGRKLIPVGTVVKFRVVRQTVAGKKDRAVEVEAA